MRTEYFSETARRRPDISPQARPGRGDVLVDNGEYFQVLHAAVVDDAGALLYDLPIVWDKGGGGVAIPVTANGRICFVEILRPVAADPSATGTEAPPADLSALGVVSLELPRGFAEGDEAWAATALREATEELTLTMTGAAQIGWVNPNTSTTVHSTGVVTLRAGAAVASTASTGTDVPGAERILAVRTMSEDEVWEAVRERTIFCGFTLAALMLYFASREARGSR